MENDNQVVSLWLELRALVEETEPHLVKNAKGTAAAGVRARKGLRELKAKAAELVNLTIELDKTKKTPKAEKSA